MWWDIAMLVIFAISFISNLQILATSERDIRGRIVREPMKPSVYAMSIVIQVVLIFVLAERLLSLIGGG